jgi:hypothetical protein
VRKVTLNVAFFLSQAQPVEHSKARNIIAVKFKIQVGPQVEDTGSGELTAYSMQSGMSALCQKRTFGPFCLIALVLLAKCFTSQLRIDPYSTGLSCALVKHLAATESRAIRGCFLLRQIFKTD